MTPAALIAGIITEYGVIRAAVRADDSGIASRPAIAADRAEDVPS